MVLDCFEEGLKGKGSLASPGPDILPIFSSGSEFGLELSQW